MKSHGEQRPLLGVPGLALNSWPQQAFLVTIELRFIFLDLGSDPFTFLYGMDLVPDPDLVRYFFIYKLLLLM